MQPPINHSEINKVFPIIFLELTTLLNNLDIELKIIAISETWIKSFHINYDILFFFFFGWKILLQVKNQQKKKKCINKSKTHHKVHD